MKLKTEKSGWVRITGEGKSERSVTSQEEDKEMRKTYFTRSFHYFLYIAFG